MSRDCGQGAKCYNCSGVVSNFLLPFIESLFIDIDYSVSRATEAETAPSLKSGLVTLVAQKAIFLAIALALRLLKQLMPKNFIPLPPTPPFSSNG